MPASGTHTRIGDPLSRVDGPAKVTGAARYAAEHPAEGLLYGWVVSSTIAKGRILAIREAAARAIPGVVEIVTHANRPATALLDRAWRDEVSPPGAPFRPLHDDRVHFSAQPIALVVAETLEAARDAAGLVEVDYAPEPHATDFEAALADRFMPARKRFPLPKNRGDAWAAYAEAPVKIAEAYSLATHHHNPMEPHATTVVWEGDGRITVYDKTQGPQNVQRYLAAVFGLAAGNVRVCNPFVGGAFGSGLRPHYQVFLATLAATMLKRSVRVAMTRAQMFSHVHRPQASQAFSLAAGDDGRFRAIATEATTATSRFENYMEIIGDWALSAYACDNAAADYAIVALDTASPGDMRAPGAATGMTLFEMAVDELAHAAGKDPLEFRRLNHADTDQLKGQPYTSKALLDAYAAGAERFGWASRPAAPRSMREGRELVGWGVATGMWEALFAKTSARATLAANGQLEIATAASDIGTGTYTILTQVAAETLGLAVDRVTVRIADSDLPASPVEGGSWTAASSGAAVQLACRAVGEKLLAAARKLDGRPLGDAKIDDVVFAEGEVILAADPSRRIGFGEIMAGAGLSRIEAEETATHNTSDGKSRATHSAVFAEVKVDEELGIVRVTRIVSAIAAGRIINPKTARSQILGGVVMGIGMALHEETQTDQRLGRFMNHNFGEYHVPVNADVFDIDVIFVDEPDREVNPLGVKGVGEIGIVSTAAAIANAIWHATGKRVRDLPVTLDRLLD